MLKKCKVCGREFECYDKKKNGRGTRKKAMRPYNSKTCSRYCSKTNAYGYKPERI